MKVERYHFNTLTLQNVLYCVATFRTLIVNGDVVSCATVQNQQSNLQRVMNQVSQHYRTVQQVSQQRKEKQDWERANNILLLFSRLGAYCKH